jgi:hypothetical protein
VSDLGGCLYAAGDPAASRFAQGLAWLWRLGTVLGSPAPATVGVGGLSDADALFLAVERDELAGAIVFAPEPGAQVGAVPARRPSSGPTSFGALGTVAGDYPVFESGSSVVASAAGPHAVLCEGVLVLAVDPEQEWGGLGMAWMLDAVRSYLVGRLSRPLVMLPRIGMLRLDDLPGTAHQQLIGRAKSDRRQHRRLRRYVRAFKRAGATLNVAVPAEAMRDGVRVPLDLVWPKSIAVLKQGVEEGAVEPVGHGVLHLDTARLAEGEVEFREFAHLDLDEAGRRIDQCREWQARALGAGRTFVAPAWAYSEGALAALSDRGLPFFKRCGPGRIFEGDAMHETLISGKGNFRLDYRPLTALAEAGLPPTVVLHGTVFDGRRASLDLPRDLAAGLRLVLGRDIARLPGIEGVSWVGAGTYHEALRLHDRVVVRGDEVVVPAGASVRVLGRDGLRLVHG